MYLDAFALIVQADMDGGDTLHREASVAFGQKLVWDLQKNQIFVAADGPEYGLRSPASEAIESTSFLKNRPIPSVIIDRFEVAPGVYVRHPDPEKWYSRPDTTSRDQLLPVIAYCAAYEDYERLERLFWATLLRGFFAQNTKRIGDDEAEWKVPDPMHLNLSHFIRAGGWRTAVLYPLLLVFDALDLVGTLVTALPLHFQDDHLFPRGRMMDDVDDMNTVVSHLLAMNYKPTPISALNRYLYANLRAENFGNTIFGEENPVMGALMWYYRDSHGGTSNPEVAELYRPLVLTYFKTQSLSSWVLETFARSSEEFKEVKIGSLEVGWNSLSN